MPFAATDAVILQTPAPFILPAFVHGPDAVKLTGRPDEADALNENELPYCTFGSEAKLMVCDLALEPCGSTMNVPDTEFAGLNMVVPGCEAVMVQLPVVARVTVAEETLLASDWLLIEQDPAALKNTSNPFGAPFVMAVAVTVGGLVISTELGSGARLMLWLFLSTAGADGPLWREGPKLSGTRVVVIV